MPIGAIVEWSGSEASIPPGWQRCDGTNGTPDLRGKVTIGVDGVFPLDDTGGSVEHFHEATSGINAADAGPVGAYDVVTPTTTVGHMPPYHALFKIMHLF